MSDTKNTSGAAKNRAAGNAGSAASNSELNIPTLGSGQIPGVPEQAMQPVQAGVQAVPNGEPPQAAQQGGLQGALPGNPAQGGPSSMAEAQRIADAQQPSSMALHRPAFTRPDREQTAETPALEMEMPISGSLDAMRRPDQFIEPVTDFGRFQDKAAELAFLEEMVMIRIHESGDPAAEAVVQLGVNGRQVFIKRGEDVIVRRKYVEQLLRAKPENISTNIRRDADGNVRNMIGKTRALKYPFSIVRDDNPRGRAWERKIRTEA